MDSKFYARTPERLLKGRKVKSLQAMINSMGQFPAGTVWTINRKFNGLGLISEPCPHCGRQGRMSKVPARYVVLLPENKEDVLKELQDAMARSNDKELRDYARVTLDGKKINTLLSKAKRQLNEGI